MIDSRGHGIFSIMNKKSRIDKPVDNLDKNVLQDFKELVVEQTPPPTEISDKEALNNAIRYQNKLVDEVSEKDKKIASLTKINNELQTELVETIRIDNDRHEFVEWCCSTLGTQKTTIEDAKSRIKTIIDLESQINKVQKDFGKQIEETNGHDKVLQNEAEAIKAEFIKLSEHANTISGRLNGLEQQINLHKEQKKKLNGFSQAIKKIKDGLWKK